MTRNRKTFGAKGEASAISYLESKGYLTVDANVRPEGGMARGELDIIAWHGDCLVFVEVKTRRYAHGAQGTPTEAVDARKRRQIVALSLTYLARHSLDEVPCRFDVVEVLEEKTGPHRFRLIPNAFDASDTDLC